MSRRVDLSEVIFKLVKNVPNYFKYVKDKTIFCVLVNDLGEV